MFLIRKIIACLTSGNTWEIAAQFSPLLFRLPTPAYTTGKAQIIIFVDPVGITWGPSSEVRWLLSQKSDQQAFHSPVPFGRKSLADRTGNQHVATTEFHPGSRSDNFHWWFELHVCTVLTRHVKASIAHDILNLTIVDLWIAVMTEMERSTSSWEWEK